jgi:hypothetical protein
MKNIKLVNIFAMALAVATFVACTSAVTPIIVSVGVRTAAYMAAKNNPQLIVPLEAVGAGLVAIESGATVDVIHKTITDLVLSQIKDPVLRMGADDVLEIALAAYGQAIVDNVSSTDAKALLTAIGNAISEGAALAGQPATAKYGAAAVPTSAKLKPSFTLASKHHIFVVD